MPSHNSRDRRQAQPTAGELGREERIEDPGHRCLIHATTGIGDVEPDVIPGLDLGIQFLADLALIQLAQPRPDRNYARVVADRFYGVEDEIHHDLLDLARVGFDGWDIVRQFEMSGDMAWNGRVEQTRDLLNQLRQVDSVYEELPFPRIGQHLPRQMRGALAGIDDFGQDLMDGAVIRNHLLGQTGVAEDGDEQVIEIVCNSAGQQADAFELLLFE